MNNGHVQIPCAAVRPLEPVLYSWIACTHRYVDIWDGNDLPYWYNEQANVSILAGAAWKADWTAIEEYQINKVATEASENASLIGRNDLYVADDNHGFCIEAKVAYVPINNVPYARDRIIERCRLAKADALRVDYHDPKLGAVFIAPYSPGCVATPGQILEFAKMLQTLPHDALAWACPIDAQKTPSHDNKHYPMIALLLVNAETSKQS
ncbi:hypothetical protein [Pseudomonas sp. PSE1(2024)]|jgi:hypothetical protein|uniref:hypothetical protein n=1 Tax=Pseudomonas sp. PSE1(2024) TaxID=3228746 RepID=UPI003D95988E